ARKAPDAITLELRVCTHGEALTPLYPPFARGDSRTSAERERSTRVPETQSCGEVSRPRDPGGPEGPAPRARSGPAPRDPRRTRKRGDADVLKYPDGSSIGSPELCAEVTEAPEMRLRHCRATVRRAMASIVVFAACLAAIMGNYRARLYDDS